MSSETISNVTDAFLQIWTVVGPVVAALLATWLSHRHQERIERRRERGQIAAEHRQVNRQLYLEALQFADRARDKVGVWAILATLYVSGTSDDDAEKQTPRWMKMHEAIEDAEKAISTLSAEGRAQLRTLRATGDKNIADRFAEVIATFRVESTRISSVPLPLPQDADITLDRLPTLNRIDRITDVDRRIELAVESLSEAVAGVLATHAAEPPFI